MPAVALDGALTIDPTAPEGLSSDVQAQFETRLTNLLNFPASQAPASAANDPTLSAVAPPIYGGRHAGSVTVPPEAGWLRTLNLDPRLIAKLLTQSYDFVGVGCTGPTSSGIGCDSAVDGNPGSLFADPEFKKLNRRILPPDFALNFGSCCLNLRANSCLEPLGAMKCIRVIPPKPRKLILDSPSRAFRPLKHPTRH